MDERHVSMTGYHSESYPWEGCSPQHERIFGGYRGLLSAMLVLGILGVLLSAAASIPFPGFHIIMTSLLALPLGLLSAYREKRTLAQMKISTLPALSFQKRNIYPLHSKASAQ